MLRSGLRSSRRLSLSVRWTLRPLLSFRQISSSFEKLPPKQGLYDPGYERDSCGVGLVARLSGGRTREVVEDANRMLVRMAHRGACGCEQNTGDGAGMMIGMPHEYFQSVCNLEMGTTLGPPGSYATGIVFLPKNSDVTVRIKNIFADKLKEEGLRLLGWRQVQVDNSTIGPSALATEPSMQQLFVENTHKLSPNAFDVQLYRLRNAVELAAKRDPAIQGDLYVCSLSCQTITYKGQLTSQQLMPYFQDLQQPTFASQFALVHSRFSTNTFPSWPRAQPNRMMCHNGEINTLRGNRNWLQSRAGHMRSPVLGGLGGGDCLVTVGGAGVAVERSSPATHALSGVSAAHRPVVVNNATDLSMPVTSALKPHYGADLLQQATNTDDLSDSGCFDKVLELLARGSDLRSLPECVMMMIPEAWQDNPSLSDTKKAFYQYNACVMEPWDGPAMIAFTDGRYVGATLDRNGLRPSRFYVTHDDVVLLASEVGVVPDLPDAEVKIKSRLEPGKMFLLDLQEGKIVSDGEIKETVASKHSYAAWLQDGLFTLSDWVQHATTPVQWSGETAVRESCAVGANSKGPKLVDVTNSTANTTAGVPTASTTTTVGAVNTTTINTTQLEHKLALFGYTVETLDMLLYPMGVGGKEALGSMGNDAALAVLSQQPRMLFDYFKQLFAQVTNPPIDPIREELVMSLQCPVGPEGNLLEVRAEHCARMVVEHPILTVEEVQAVQRSRYRGWRSQTLDCTLPTTATAADLTAALETLCAQASDAVRGHNADEAVQVLVLSDRAAGPDRLPIPSLLALGAVHQHLLRAQLRPSVALFVECGDAREVHDFCTLLGFGADGICPYFAFDTLSYMNANGSISARALDTFTDEELQWKYRKAAAKGILKVMAKMGISTLQSYKGAQVFEALGLSAEVMNRCFTGTASRIGGATFATLLQDVQRRHNDAYPVHTDHIPALANTGQFHLRHGGEAHLNTPEGMTALQLAAALNSQQKYQEYVLATDRQNRAVTLRGLLRFRFEGAGKGEGLGAGTGLNSCDENVTTSGNKKNVNGSIPLEEVESASAIVRRFNTGAMSLGSISQETHEALAIAMNTIGARSNTGEGGEDPRRFVDNRRSAIKQIASGRFGVTSYYLANADQLQIKMAQGAKPGEGGELPGYKVTPYIAENRATTPGVGLISPPPHHDIYSIEDLAQLIYDLKNANPVAEVSVKLVSEVGVGVVAAGVAKARADHITISGGDGGTGAAAWTGVKGAGLPWELGLSEAHQTLVLNGLRSRVTLQTDGQLKTGRDVVIAAILGAEEFGFATAPLITLGCIMMRKCHLNSCPVGVATQDPVLRKKFTGKPESVINYFFLLAEEVRWYLSQMGVRSLTELVGRTDQLEVNPEALQGKHHSIDLAPLLVSAAQLNATAGTTKQQAQQHQLENALDHMFLQRAEQTLEDGTPITIDSAICNQNRSIGTLLSYHISRRYGSSGLPDGTIHLRLTGHGGQSLGFALARGVYLEVEGDSNDYVGKSLSGGKIAIYPHHDALLRDFASHENVIVGNVCLYGATSGRAYIRGRAGERFAVRNSGAIAVVEGVGDHGCEYMTGGRVVVLGETGRNFAAGMSGGIAYVYDPRGRFPERCNRGMVTLEKVTDELEMAELGGYLEQHMLHTGSTLAENLLVKWPVGASRFVKVMPLDYKRVLEAEARAREAAATAAKAREQQQADPAQQKDEQLPYV